MPIDRDIQLEILRALSKKYPERANVNELSAISDADKLNINLNYLAEHGLIEPKMHPQPHPPRVMFATITAKGLDLMKGDKGPESIVSR